MRYTTDRNKNANVQLWDENEFAFHLESGKQSLQNSLVMAVESAWAPGWLSTLGSCANQYMPAMYSIDCTHSMLQA